MHSLLSKTFRLFALGAACLVASLAKDAHAAILTFDFDTII